MLTAKKAMERLLSSGLCTTGSVKRQMSSDYPAYTRVEGHGRVNVSEETYGSKSEMYFRCTNESTSLEAQRLLRELGGEPNLGWNGENPCYFSCPISPIKGYHWWE